MNEEEKLRFNQKLNENMLSVADIERNQKNMHFSIKELKRAFDAQSNKISRTITKQIDNEGRVDDTEHGGIFDSQSVEEQISQITEMSKVDTTKVEKGSRHI